MFSKKAILKNNLKVLQERNADLYKRDIQHQKENQLLRAEIVKLKLELEDTKGFLEQETAAKEELKKERTKLKSKITRLEKEKQNN